MRIPDVRQRAAEKGIMLDNVSYADLIRSIQRAEGNMECYDTGMAVECGQHDCVWKYICH